MAFSETLAKASWTDASVLVASLVTAYVLATTVYRLFFHPLAKYPGPFWARLLTIPSYWHTIKQDRHLWLWQLQQEYGTTFRYRPDSVVINTPTAYQHLFGPKGNVKKGLYYNAWPRNSESLTTWNSTNIAIHARKRRVLNYSFSDKALRSAEPFILSNANRWVELLGDEINQSGQEWSKSLNMADWANWLVFDILGDLCFGKSFDMKEPGSDMKEVPELMADMLKLMHPIAFSPFAAAWVWSKSRGLDWLLAIAAPPALAKWNDFVGKCLTDRTKVEEETREKLLRNETDFERRKDFFYYLFESKDPETGLGFPLPELWGEAESLIIAGSDTTAVVLTSTFFYLARYPDIQAKLANEVSSKFSSVEEIASGKKLQSCTYLRAVIQEALRMTPPVSAEPPRETLKGGTVVDGDFFPEGLNVSVGHYCISFNKDIYPDPFKFTPERWLLGDGTAGGATAESIELAESAFVAFSTGPRGCPGKNLAWLEMTIVIAKVIYMFEIRSSLDNNLGGGSPDGRLGRRNVDQYQTYDAFVSLRDGPLVQLRHRKHL